LTLDAIDRALLEALQRDNQRSNADLAASVGLSAAAVHKRIRKLREQGYVQHDVALLDRHRLGLDLLCFLKIAFKQNLSPANYQELRDALGFMPEALECYALTGSVDAIVKVLVPDHVGLKNFLQRLSEAQDLIAHVDTSIVLEDIKATTSLPLSKGAP
jgi:Lrp/AsnC family leucine-responsive transcriptional regulator